MEKQVPNLGEINSTIQTLLFSGAITELVEYMDFNIERFNEMVLSSINKTISKPSNLRFLIDKLLNDRNQLKTIRENSYCHENGFHKIVLLYGNNFKLRLHHFGKTGKAGKENVHDHRWPFVSTILKGALHMEMFTVTNEINNSEQLLHHIYDSDKVGGSYKAQLQGVSNLKMVEKMSFHAGLTYILPAEILHRITNTENQECITLILTGKPVNSKCNLFARNILTDEEKKTPRYTNDELLHHLSNLGETVYPKNN